MRALRLISLWLAIVVLFAICGWIIDESYSGYNNDGPFYTDLRFEAAVGFAAVGVGVAAYVVAGLILLNAVRRRLRRAWAALLLLAAAVAAPFLSGVVVFVIMRATQYRGGDYKAGIHLFQGEDGLWLLIAPFYTFWIILCAFVVFLVCVFRVARSNTTL